MTFAHDTEVALVAAAALVNSASDGDSLQTPEDLVTFLDDAGVVRQPDRRPGRARGGPGSPAAAARALAAP